MNTSLLESVQKRSLFLASLREKGDFEHPAWSRARYSCYLKDAATLGYHAEGAKLLGDPDVGAASAPFVISTTSKDRHGDVVLAAGCVKTLGRYKENPRVFFSHGSWTFPVGSSRTPEGKSTVEVYEDKILATVHFHLKTQESEQVFALVCAKELEAASIGFLPIKGTFIDAPERPKDRDVIVFDWGGLVFEEWDLTEWSVVPVPANPDAVSMRLANGIDGRPLAHPLRKALEPFAAPQKVWAPGVDLSEPSPPPPSSTTEDPPAIPAATSADASGQGKSEREGAQTEVAAGDLMTPKEAFYQVWEGRGTSRDEIDKKWEKALEKSLESTAALEKREESGVTMADFLLRNEVRVPLVKDHDSPEMKPPLVLESEEVPYGCKVLCQHICLLGEYCGKLVASMKLLENPSLKKALEKLYGRVEKEIEGLQALGAEHYPEQFAPKEEAASTPVEEPAKSATPAPAKIVVELPLPSPKPQKEAPSKWAEVLRALDSLTASHQSLCAQYTHLTGRKL